LIKLNKGFKNHSGDLIQWEDQSPKNDSHLMQEQQQVSQYAIVETIQHMQAHMITLTEKVRRLEGLEQNREQG